jgi:hypothetical protein
MKRKEPPTSAEEEGTAKEARVNPLIAVRTRKYLHSLTVEQCDQQLQSPLFGKLPAELRHTIFHLAIGPYENNARPLKTKARNRMGSNFDCLLTHFVAERGGEHI